MQKRSLETINLVDDDEDDDFLSQVAEVEAQALAQAVSSKRVKPSLPTRIVADAYAYEKPEIKPQAEGVYLAALRGDDASPSWLHQQSGVAQLGFGGRSGAGGGGGSGDNACFKCGKLGHWARDCDGGPIGGGGAMQSGELQKACPCGLGECLVLTANTERNRGRRFYKCPVREENGGCGFFEWCDSASGTSNLSSVATQSGFTSSFPDLSCPCGAGSCLILTAKTGNNVGQQFYRCPANQRNSCGFFKWCNDRIDVVPGSPLIANKSYRSFNNSNSTGSGVGGESSCFKCGKEGHWAKDCSSSSSDQFFGSSGKSSSTGSCFKCGKSGHWARDCLSSQNLNMSK